MTVPRSFWLRAIAKRSDPAMLIGMAAIRTSVFQQYFPKKGSFVNSIKLASPANRGHSDKRSHFTKLRHRDANTGIEVNRRNPIRLGARNPYATIASFVLSL